MILILLLSACTPDGKRSDTSAPDAAGPPVDTAAWCVPTEDLDGIGKDWDCDGYASDGYAGGTDCDDADPAVHPGAEELCNGIDDDCDGEPEAPESYTTWYPDADGDGYGTDEGGVTSCVPLAGATERGGDCDDTESAVHPGATEACDGVDGNCDGWVADERDADGDGQRLCGGDCDDTDPDVYAGAPETCDTRDLDCDGIPGSSDDDADGVAVCAGDCDDADPDIHPGAAEQCNGLDDDCDGVVPADEVDGDGDGSRLCDADCDDADATRRPGFVDTCGDGIDEDCDGAADADCSECDIAVPNDVPTIQGGIDTASPGDVVCVGPGTWFENLDFGGRDITVEGVEGAEATIVDGGGLDSAVRFSSGESADAVLRGFTLTNGLPYDGGGGIHVEDASPTLVDLVVVENGAYWDAAGIFILDGSPTLTDILVSGNVAYAWYCAASYGDGGGIGVVRGDVVIDGVTVTDNSAGEYGGGIYLDDTTAVLTNVRVSGNGAGLGGAGLHIFGGDVTLTNARISGNATGTYWGLGSSPFGGGLAMFSATVTLENVTIADNVDDVGAGALYTYGSTLDLVNVLVTGNTTGIYADGGDTVLAYTDVWSNGGADYTGLADPTGTDGNVSLDPVLLAGGQLDADSPLVDAGSPTLLDPDGSVSDIGAFGGAGASLWDADLDGWPAWWLPGAWDAATSPDSDCDDEDAGVFPGAGC